MKTYDIYLVPNGRLLDFERGYLGSGYPDACKCIENDITLDEVRERYRELADENFRCEGGEYDRIFDECEKRTDEDIAALSNGWHVLDNEGYGSVAGLYCKVPTNRQFWTECGMPEDDIKNPEDEVPTVPLYEYIVERESLSNIVCADAKQEQIVKRINELLVSKRKGYAEPEVACQRYLDELTADANPLNWSRIEWHGDLKWVCVREHVEV